MFFYFQHSVWFIASLTFATALLWSSAYTLAPIILLIVSFYKFGKWSRKKLSKDDILLISIFILYALGMFFFVYLDGWLLRELDKPSRFLLAIPVLLLLMNMQGKKELLFYGVIFGAFGSFCVGFYEVYYLNFGRAQGETHPIMFGNTALMLGLMSFVSAMWFKHKKRNALLILALIAGGLGVGASILSASRGGWIGLPFIIIFLVWQSKDLIGFKKSILISIFAVISLSIIVLVPQTGVQDRFSQAYDDVNRFKHGDLVENSVGQRFEMWKGAWFLFSDSPFFGVGKYKAIEVKEELMKQGKLNPIIRGFNHAHNEYIDALSLRGGVGFILLISIYICPLLLFMKKAFKYKDNWDVKAYALTGALVPICYMDFALSQSMFSHNIGVMMYAFPIAYFWAATRWAEKRTISSSPK